MHPLIANILKKRNIKNVQELNQEEQGIFYNWERILSEGEVTTEKIKQFCEKEIKTIENQYTNPDNSDKKDNYLKACLSVYSAIIKIIDGKKAEKEALEKYLIQLTK